MKCHFTERLLFLFFSPTDARVVVTDRKRLPKRLVARRSVERGRDVIGREGARGAARRRATDAAVHEQTSLRLLITLPANPSPDPPERWDRTFPPTPHPPDGSTFTYQHSASQRSLSASLPFPPLPLLLVLFFLSFFFPLLPLLLSPSLFLFPFFPHSLCLVVRQMLGRREREGEREREVDDEWKDKRRRGDPGIGTEEDVARSHGG